MSLHAADARSISTESINRIVRIRHHLLPYRLFSTQLDRCGRSQTLIRHNTSFFRTHTNTTTTTTTTAAAAASRLREQIDGGDGPEDDLVVYTESQPLTSAAGGIRSGHSTPYHDDLPNTSGSGHRTPSSTFGHSLDPGAYWRLAEQASTIPSTRSLERTQSGTFKERQDAYWKAAIVNILLILSWYTFSTLISVYNKWMFSTEKKNFSYPLFVTSFHMAMQFALSSTAMRLFPQLVPRRANGTTSRPSVWIGSEKSFPCAPSNRAGYRPIEYIPQNDHAYVLHHV